MKNTNRYIKKLKSKEKDLLKRAHSEYFKFEKRLSDDLVKEIYFQKEISRKTKVNFCPHCTNWVKNRETNKRRKADRKLLKELFDLDNY